MIKQKWEISEEEKNRILNLHESATKKMYLIKEQVEQYTDNFGDNFESGQYQLSPKFKESMKYKIAKLVEFVKEKNLKNFKIVITPGESQVTNQPGFERQGSLAEARAHSLEDYLNQVLPQMLRGYSPKIEITKPVIGKTPYDKTKDKKDDPRYKNEQFVKVSVVLNTENVPQTKPNPYKAISDFGEPIYLGNNLFGKVLVSSRITDEITKSGNLDTSKQTNYLAQYQKDTVPPKIEVLYTIPSDWWNQNVGPTRTLSQDILNKIQQFKTS